MADNDFTIATSETSTLIEITPKAFLATDPGKEICITVEPGGTVTLGPGTIILEAPLKIVGVESVE